MSSLADIQRTIQATLASKRVGQPVFVRCTIQGTDRGDAIVARLAGLTALTQECMGQPLESIHATGKAAEGQVALALRFRGGAAALLSYARTQPRGDGLDLMILGNRGAVYHDAGSGNLWEEPLDARKADGAVRATIERALQSGKPEPFTEEARP